MTFGSCAAFGPRAHGVYERALRKLIIDYWLEECQMWLVLRKRLRNSSRFLSISRQIKKRPRYHSIVD